MDLQTILLSALYTLIMALVSWAVSKLIAWLNAKIKDTKATLFLTEAVGVIETIVKATFQTYVQALKNKDLFDEVAQKEALNKTIASIKNTLSEEVKNYITNNYGDLTEWIRLKIESTLYDLKNKPK